MDRGNKFVSYLRRPEFISGPHRTSMQFACRFALHKVDLACEVLKQVQHDGVLMSFHLQCPGIYSLSMAAFYS
jgi:hypothetical protein